MRKPKGHKTHKRILQKASERFRSEGIEAVSVASLMQSVGMTASGLYAYFGSKEEMIAEACADGFSTTISLFREFVESKPAGERLCALVNAYLSEHQRDELETGCHIAANGAELARYPAETRTAFSGQIKRWVKLIDDVLRADGMRGDAGGIASVLVGTMILARSISDPLLSKAFLESGRNTILASVQKQSPRTYRRQPSAIKAE